jgi:hypothetical protein
MVYSLRKAEKQPMQKPDGKRRPEIVKMFEGHQFGKMPPRPLDVHLNIFDKGMLNNARL